MCPIVQATRLPPKLAQGSTESKYMRKASRVRAYPSPARTVNVPNGPKTLLVNRHVFASPNRQTTTTHLVWRRSSWCAVNALSLIYTSRRKVFGSKLNYFVPCTFLWGCSVTNVFIHQNMQWHSSCDMPWETMYAGRLATRIHFPDHPFRSLHTWITPSARIAWDMCDDNIIHYYATGQQSVCIPHILECLP